MPVFCDPSNRTALAPVSSGASVRPIELTDFLRAYFDSFQVGKKIEMGVPDAGDKLGRLKPLRRSKKARASRYDAPERPQGPSSSSAPNLHRVFTDYIDESSDP